MATLKAFNVTQSDISFLLSQVRFPTIKIVGYDSSGTPIYGYVDELGNTVEIGLLGSFDPLNASFSQYYSALDPSGIRNPDGTLNNLTSSITSSWGATGQDFMRLVHADYGHYVSENLSNTALDPGTHNFHGVTNGVTTQADYSNPFASVVDYTPRMISQTVTSCSDSSSGATGMDTAIANGLETETLNFTDNNGGAHTETFIRSVNSVALDPSLSGWNTLFGQFFDHGLDFIAKPGGGPTITIALSPDDPLYGKIGPDGQPVTAIVINRATPDAGTGVGGVEAQYTNHTSPYIDQSQTYGSDSQVTALLREWVLNPNYDPSLPATDPNSRHYVAGAALLDGHHTVAYHSNVFNDAAPTGLGDGMTTRTLPTLNELRLALADTGRADITWEDIANFRARGDHGEVLDIDPGTAGIQSKLTGQALVLDMNPRFDAGHITADAIAAINSQFGTSFSTDFAGPSKISLGAMIANGWINPATFAVNDTLFGVPGGAAISAAQRDAVGEVLLESIGDHYIAGDGRANENFGLTALHHVFHEDHNVQLVNLENTILAQDSATDRQAWQTQTAHLGSDGNYYNTAPAATNLDHSQVSWDQDRVFNAAKLIVEMEYQHVAIDQYARLITPDLPEFVTYDSNINADIALEYAQAAFRFGHSQLRETIDALDPNGAINGAIQHYLLKDAFLNPAQFAAEGAGAIVQGMTRQVANEIDEFLTPAMQQSLLGQPMDLAAINIARGRDLGIPTLNETRKAIYDALVAERAGGTPGQPGPHAKLDLDLLKPYNSWNEFAANMGHPESLVSLIAAYSFDGDRAHAQAIIDADATGLAQTYSGGTVTAFQATQFLSGARDASGSYLQAGADGYNKIDLWLGGLAESHVIGGQLGYTFNAIFLDQMERLMDGDRLYYLYRLGLALPLVTDLNQSIVTEQFKDIIERTTGVTHLNGDVMLHADSILELGQTANTGIHLLETDGTQRLVGGQPVFETAQNAHKYGAFDELSSADGSVLVAGQTLAGFAAAHGGHGVYSTSGNNTSLNGMDISVQNPEDHAFNTYILDQRPDSPSDNANGNPTYGYNSHEILAGTDFADFLDAGDGDDTAYGDAGDDIIVGNGGGDHLYGGAGNDVMMGGGGGAGADVEDFMDGGDGDDIMYGGQNNGATEVVIGGAGNDHIYGEAGIDELYGMDGDDVIDSGGDTDLVFGGYGNDQLFGGEGPDELHGQVGDDIVSGGTGTDKLLGEQGDDILLGGIGQGAVVGDSDELIGDVGFDVASYSDLNGKLDHAVDLNNQNLVATPGQPLFEAFNQLLTGMEGVIGTKLDDKFGAVGSETAALIGDASDNWLIGGSGNDGLLGGGGNDVIVGGSIRLDSLIGTFTGDYDNTLADGTSHRVAANAALQNNGLLDAAGMAAGKHFQDLLRSGAYQNFVLGDTGTDGAADFAVFSGNRSDYTITTINFVDAHGAPITAYKVVDNRSGSADGTDLVVGIEQFRFADRTVSFDQLTNRAPSGALSFTGANNFAGTLSQLTISGANLFDADNVSVSNPLGTVTIPNGNANRNWQTSTDGGITWTNVPTGNGSGQQSNNTRVLNQGTTSGKLIRATGSYTDAGGFSQTVTSPVWNLIVGAAAADLALSGTASAAVGDVIFGLGGNDVINAQAGADYLFGGNGNDTLYGGSGDDVLDGGSGANTLVGANGSDTYVLGAGTNTIVETGTGVGDKDTIVANGTFSIAGATYVGIENLTISGNGGNATGNASGNVLTGNSGNNTLDGGLGADTMVGGSGNDTYIVDNAGDVVVELANGGTDTVRSSAANYTLADNVENLVLTGAGDINGAGNSLANILTGNSGNNILLGADGNDRFVASGTSASPDGNDTFNGGAGVDTYDLSGTSAAATVNLAAGTSASAQTGADTLISIENVIGSSVGDTIAGSANANVITGGRGVDVMTGGGGHDIFVFNFVTGPNAETGNTVSLRDQITDFRAAAELGGATESDRIDLSGIDANTGSGGNNVFIFDGFSATGNNARGHVGFHYETIAGNDRTVVAGNTSINGSNHDFQVDLVGHVLLTSADFIV